MTTRHQAREEEALQAKIRDIQDKKNALAQHLEQAQARAAGENGTQHDQNSEELRGLLNQINETEQEEARLFATRNDHGRKPDGSEMDVDAAVPKFSQTQDENLPTNEGDPAVKTESTNEIGEAPQSGGLTNPQSIRATNPPIQSTEQEGESVRGLATRVDDDIDDDVLVNLQTMSISTQGVADAWFRTRQGTKAIVRLGPKRYPKYEVRPGKGYSTANLQEVSDTESRISCIMMRDETGRKRRLYGIENIAGLDGAATLGNGAVTSFLRAPTTYVKIKWVGIREEHTHLCRNGKNWAPRSDLIAIIGKELADENIRQLWDVQEKRYAEWENGQMGRRSSDRSPTPFPLDVYQEFRKARGSIPPEVHRGPTVKREEEPLFMPGPHRTEGTSLASGNQASTDSSPTSTGARSSETTDAGGSGAPGHGRDGFGNPNADEQKPKTFSERQYLENMKQDLGLEELQNSDMGKYIEQMALVRAKFDAYRGEMERQGYVLVQ